MDQEFLIRKLAQRILARFRARDYGRWLGRGFWAITDQGLFAASNFALSILLARWLVPQDYGAFMVAYTIFWLLGTFYIAVLMEPMLVFGSVLYEGRLSGYLSVLLYGHIGVTALICVAFLLASLGFGLAGSATLSSALLGLALASPFIYFQWLTRRMCYVYLGPHLAALGGALYMVLMLSGTYVAYRGGWLSPAVAFGLMGFASLAASLWLAVRLRLRPPSLRGNGLILEAFGKHWGYGRWAVVIGALGVLSGNIYYLLLPVWGGLEASAALRALLNPITPVVQTCVAFLNILLPALVQTRGHAGFKKRFYLVLALFLSGAAVYWALLGLFHRPVMLWLYGGDQYQEYASLLWLAGLVPLVFGGMEILSTTLRALEQPKRIIWAYAFSVAIALTVGLGFLVALEVAGAVIGILLSHAAAVVILAWLLRTSGWASGEAQSSKDEA